MRYLKERGEGPLTSAHFKIESQVVLLKNSPPRVHPAPQTHENTGSVRVSNGYDLTGFYSILHDGVIKQDTKIFFGVA